MFNILGAPKKYVARQNRDTCKLKKKENCLSSCTFYQHDINTFSSKKRPGFLINSLVSNFTEL